MRISTCVITCNEEENLARCLGSAIAVSDELIVLDSGSADKTVDIARSLGSQTFFRPWTGYVDQKNHALSLARYDWVLMLDADEALSPQLAQEILKLKKITSEIQADAFLMSRVVFFQGHWIRFGDWYPDRLVRLFRKNKGRFEGGSVHERLVVDGRTRKLRHELHHFTYRDASDQMKRIERYSTLWAQDALRRGVRSYLWTPWLRAGWRLIRGFVIKKGWKGGLLGWRISRANAYEVFLKYAKLRRLILEKNA